MLVFVGVPAIRTLEGDARATAMRALGRRWRPLGLERDGRRDPLRPLVDRAQRRVCPGGARHQLRPDADPQVRARRAACGRRAAPRLRARPSAAARISALRTRLRRRRGADSSSSDGSTSRSPSGCPSWARSSSRCSSDDRTPHDRAGTRAEPTSRTLRATSRSSPVDRGRRLVARPAGGARGDRARGRRRARDGRVLRLPLRRAHGRAGAPGDPGAGIEDATSAPRMRSGEGITGAAAAGREPIMIAERAHLDPRFKAFPNLREDQYESILAVPILARDVLEGALNVRTRARRMRSPMRRSGFSRRSRRRSGSSIDHAKLYAQARQGGSGSSRRSRGSPRRFPGVPRGVARGDREDDGRVAPGDRRGRRPRGRPRRLARGARRRPCGAAAVAVARSPDRRARRRPRHTVSDDDRQLLDAIASQAAVALEHGRMALRGVLAQEIHHRVEQPPDRRLTPEAAGPRRGRGLRRRRSATRSTGSWRSPPSTRS